MAATFKPKPGKRTQIIFTVPEDTATAFTINKKEIKNNGLDFQAFMDEEIKELNTRVRTQLDKLANNIGLNGSPRAGA